MSKYTVAVTRIGYSSLNIEVEANTHEEAGRLALNKAGDFVFDEKDADYEATACWLTKDPQSEVWL